MMFKKELVVFAVIVSILSICTFSSEQETFGVLRGTRPPSSHYDRDEFAPTTFKYLWYWPAERGDFDADYWQLAPRMQPGSDGNYTAHFRDVALGAAIAVNCNGLVNGETWSATWTSPTGEVYGPSTLLYQNGCFYGGLWYFCGCGWPPYITYEEFTFYRTIQCSDTGVWTLELAHNGVVFATEYINILPQINPTFLHQPSFSQLDYNDPYDHICHSPEDYNKWIPCQDSDNTLFHYTIAEMGCALTSFCEILNYHGVTVDPPTLNNWLKAREDGFLSDGSVNYTKISDFAKAQGKTVTFLGRGIFERDLLSDICKYGPQALKVNQYPPHWVTAIGETDNLSDWLVIDPAGGVLNYTDRMYDVISFAGPGYDFTDRLNAICFGFFCPVEAYVVDPLGRKLGYDPITGKTYNEIPNSGYGGPVGGGNPDDKFLDVIGAVNGDYLVTVVGTGTTESKYEMEVYARTSSFTDTSVDMKDIYTGPNVVNKFLFHYDSANIQNSALSGGFDGGGQRPKDVNKFLSYSSPSDSQTELPSGTTTFPLLIFYDTKVISNTFKATLNGVDVSNLFHPNPGSYETVNINLAQGRNVLILSIDGNLDKRVATDTDRLVFIVK